MVRETEDKGSLETYNIHHDNLDHLLTVCLVQSLILIFSPTKPRSRIESSNRKLMIWELGPEKSCDQSLHSQHGAGPAAERGLLVAGCSLEGFIVLMCYKEPGVAEEDFAQIDTARLIKKLLGGRSPKPPCVPKEIGFRGLPDLRTLPSWLSEEDVNYYASKFSQKGFTGGLNYYRCLDLNWELLAPWTGAQIKIPVKFMVGDLDITYHIPGIREYIQNGGFKKDVPGLQEVIVMEGVAHFINQEKADEVSSHIYDFIKQF
ncbi:hypothetical protein CUMW_055960 [Citrus unshiu]|nr:hypothetical protein CUMW_055960 [Citrus unshiu]